MIKLFNVNKYFNRYKTNEIHVIDNTSLEFPDHGLIALLGNSGSGKTTLLNAIGGLDKINSGHIYVNGIKLPKSSNYKKDKIRTLNIGYIFQNFNLLDNVSVYENVALSLKMIGIKNKAEIERRVNYVLEKVGMYRFRNKPCGNLSGGQRQRVGIARAIVKNPMVIIADEPTGNLDSKNTIEIMNIVKSISQTKLVILVTHEKELANFYASRIINIVDGKVISDKENIHEDELDYAIDDNIYLKDFKTHTNVKNTGYNIDIYTDDKMKLKLDIVIKNGNIYIKTDNDKIEVVDDNSSIKFIDGHYKKIAKTDYEKTSFDLKELDNSNEKIHYASIKNIFSSIVYGFNRVLDYSKIKKVLLLGFALSSMFILYAVSNVFGVTNIKDSDFVVDNKEYLYVNVNKESIDVYNKIKKEVDYIVPGNARTTFMTNSDALYQFVNRNIFFSGSIADAKLIKNLIYGRMPSSDNEVVIDKMVYDNSNNTLYGTSFQAINVKKYEDLIGLNIMKTENSKKYTIVGISDDSSPSIYLPVNDLDNLIVDATSQYVDYHLANDILIVEGRKPTGLYEVIVNVRQKDYMPLNKQIDEEINGNKLTIVGYYKTARDDNKYYVSKDTITILNILSNKGFTVYSKNKEEALNKIKDLGYNVYDTYELSKSEYHEEIKNTLGQTFIIAGLLLAISFIEIYLMIRASFMSRIKETGIMRAIGVKKLDIYKMFAGEIIVITSLASVPGIIVMALILKELSGIIILGKMFLINHYIILLSILIVYVFNLLIGLLPIWNVIRHTPASILSRNDID